MKRIIIATALLVMHFASKCTASPTCDSRCSGGQGSCQTDGRCLCWWGWTGPNARYITSGANKNRILADYCTTACHYTHDYRNPRCASIPTPQVCSVPVNKTSPTIPCDPNCGTGSYYGRGTCLSNGRCLCWWGWTGPNSCYVDGGTYNNRIIADICVKACHYTHVYRNNSCITASATSMPTTRQSSGSPTTIMLSTASPKCDSKCGGGQGICQADGRCLCWWGWTGPNATYIMSGPNKNRILADYCKTACHYTHDYQNPSCASIPTPQLCSVPVNKTSPAIPCDPNCGTGSYYGCGTCLSNGRCLCWWGWTGPNSCYVDGGTYNNRIIADSCVKACHYTHVFRNYLCVTSAPTAVPSTQAPSTGSPTTIMLSTASPKCDSKCGGGQGICQADGRCLCWWGWTGPNATYIMSGPNKNRILADYCKTACHYTHDYQNPSCASIPTPQLCSVPVNKTSPAIPCDPNCGTGSYYGRGTCLSNGRCLCWWGWTGPNSCYVDGGTYNNRIIADSCVKACHYTHVFRNYLCVTSAPTAVPSTQAPSTGSPTTIMLSTASPKCDSKCGGGQGICQADGRCLCWWGWTGPNATYIMSGPNKNRILADYCKTACHYTHDYQNPSCASIPTPQLCSVPVNKTSPAIPCDPNCGTGSYYGRGTCLSNGRCLCWWGWTGPNSCYVDGGTYNNRIIADSCVKACHYTHVFRNYLCVTSAPTAVPSTQAPSTGSPTTIMLSTASPKCDSKCGGGQGICQADGRCLCWWGWTGPNATYIMSGPNKNRILADYCKTACHYTHDYQNPSCASIPTPQLCSVPVNKTSPAIPCDPNCGTGSYYGRGTCLSNGRCLCWWGWTGPNSCYVDGGTYNNRIIADSCVKACHYTHVFRNYLCVTSAPTAVPSTQAPSTGSPTTIMLSTASPKCDSKCGGGQGICQADGRCLCWWGWTGPNATYIMSGPNKNRILADYCKTACHYTHDYQNPSCASIPTPQVCSVPVNKTSPGIPCDPNCGTGSYYGRGTCLSNGRCLCWWGWTGPNSCYVDGGTYNNRIIADSCVKACHYTHVFRNYSCVTSAPTAVPSTQAPSTGIPTTGNPSTVQPTTRQLTTGQPKTSNQPTGVSSTGIPTSEQMSTSQPLTSKPTTGQPSTRVSTTWNPTTEKVTTGRWSSTAQPSTAQPTAVTSGWPSTRKTPARSTTSSSTTKQMTSNVPETTVTTTMSPSTSGKTTSERVTTTKAATTKETTVSSAPLTTTTAVPPTTGLKTTTRRVISTTTIATTTQVTTTAAPTEPPEPTEPTEPPEPTEPTEPPGGILIRGMAPHQDMVQNDVDVDVGALRDEDKENEKEGKSFSPTGLVIILVVLLLCMLGLVIGVWWSFGNGNHIPSLLRGYEPVGDQDNMPMRELSESSTFP